MQQPGDHIWRDGTRQKNWADAIFSANCPFTTSNPCSGSGVWHGGFVGWNYLLSPRGPSILDMTAVDTRPRLLADLSQDHEGAKAEGSYFQNLYEQTMEMLKLAAPLSDDSGFLPVPFKLVTDLGGGDPGDLASLYFAHLDTGRCFSLWPFGFV